MTKYILVLVILCGLFLMADPPQQGNPTTSLDQPLNPVTPSLMKIRVVGNYFNNWSIAGIIGTLATMQIGPSGTNLWSHYYVDNPNTTESETGNAALLKAELLAYYNNFPQGSEVFSASLNNGKTGYVDSYGYNIQNGNGNNQTYDDYMGAPTNNYALNFYAGRNTAAGDNNPNYYGNINTASSEVIITTSTGNEYKIYAYDSTTPLVLDMDGDGRLEASKGEWLPHTLNQKAEQLREFDMNGDGFDELVEWIGPNDGLLLTYTPGEKVTGNNLFGFAKGYVDGFEQLSTLDANNDSKIAGEELNTLSVWQDKNSNARVDAGEVMSVKELGITELGVRHANLISFFVQNGKNSTVWDWHPVMMMVKKSR
jgi:hypothetical protein